MALPAGPSAPANPVPAGVSGPYPTQPAGPSNPPTTTYSITRTLYQPTNGPAYNAFEQEIIAGAVADRATILLKHQNLFRDTTPGVTADMLSAYITAQNSFVTLYTTWLAS